MKKILIVDDQEKIRKLLALTIQGIGDYEILEVESGKRALEVVRNEKPTLIIMDIMLSGTMDWLEAINIIKNDPDTQNTIIVMLSAKSQQSDIRKGMEAGADSYFISPFSPTALVNKVEEVFGEMR